jgi:G:T-mismatch repair DNA endonuclease (very short patch repair protein)
MNFDCGSCARHKVNVKRNVNIDKSGVRYCPSCTTKMTYSNAGNCRIAEKRGIICHPCAMKLRDKKFQTGELTSKQNNTSKLELSIKSLMTQLGFIHSKEREQPTIGQYTPDYVNETTQVIIEVFGDHYHGNPTLKWYGNKDRVISTNKKTGRRLTVRDKHAKDTRKLTYYATKGFHTIVLWEHDINSKSQDELREMIEAKL